MTRGTPIYGTHLQGLQTRRHGCYRDVIYGAHLHGLQLEGQEIHEFRS